jgi:hypothetical protein
MSDKEPISLLTASIKTHFVAIVIFTVLFGLFYVFKYTDYFKSIKDILNNWGVPFLSDTNDDKKKYITSLDEDSDAESDDEIDELNNNKNIRDVLSPF